MMENLGVFQNIINSVCLDFELLFTQLSNRKMSLGNGFGFYGFLTHSDKH